MIELAMILVLLATFLFRKAYFIAIVESDSMMPKLKAGDRVLVRRTFKSNTHLRPGTIIVLKRTVNGEKKYYIKRIAVCGPTEYIFMNKQIQPNKKQAIWVEKGWYFVLGDHENSVDSRIWGSIKNDQVVGIVILLLNKHYYRGLKLIRIKLRRVFIYFYLIKDENGIALSSKKCPKPVYGLIRF